MYEVKSCTMIDHEFTTHPQNIYARNWLTKYACVTFERLSEMQSMQWCDGKSTLLVFFQHLWQHLQMKRGAPAVQTSHWSAHGSTTTPITIFCHICRHRVLTFPLWKHTTKRKMHQRMSGTSNHWNLQQQLLIAYKYGLRLKQHIEKISYRKGARNSTKDHTLSNSYLQRGVSHWTFKS